MEPTPRQNALRMSTKFIFGLVYIEDITRWREDMNFMFEWQEQYLTSERSTSGLVPSKTLSSI